jgi:hypothetical protein
LRPKVDDSAKTFLMRRSPVLEVCPVELVFNRGVSRSESGNHAALTEVVDEGDLFSETERLV